MCICGDQVTASWDEENGIMGRGIILVGVLLAREYHGAYRGGIGMGIGIGNGVHKVRSVTRLDASQFWPSVFSSGRAVLSRKLFCMILSRGNVGISMGMGIVLYDRMASGTRNTERGMRVIVRENNTLSPTFPTCLNRASVSLRWVGFSA